MMFVACLAASISARATQAWSGYVTIVEVSNYLAYNNTINLAVSPGISGCNVNGIVGSVTFAVGQEGVTTSNISSFLASALAGLTAGRQVTIFYDNATSSCYGVVVANGGYSGQC
jgi:hypothetical protein